MFCPKCGVPLTPREAPYPSFYCAPGEMEMSARLAGTLVQRYGETADSAPQSALPAFNRQIHGSLRWYCPGCGVRLNDHLECPRCGQHVRDLVFDVVELHSHSPTAP